MTRSALVLKALVAVPLVAFSAAGPVAAQSKGGVLRVGNLGEPPALDPHWTTASITETLTNHIYEGLYSLDSSNKPIPMLAEGVTISKDGLVYTFKLRQGVKFHNGKEMTSADVVPSLRRWGRVASVGRVLWKYVESVDAKDPYTVVISMKQPSSSLVYGLSEAAAAHAYIESRQAVGRVLLIP